MKTDNNELINKILVRLFQFGLGLVLIYGIIIIIKTLIKAVS